LKIMVDDDVVRALPEGQDMVIELSGVRNDAQSPKNDVDMNSSDRLTSSSVEVKLIF
jgi:hypothetical protein